MKLNINKESYNDYLIKMRRYFHKNPEISCKEFNTSKVIKEELDKMNIEWRACGLETGVLATIKGKKPGKTILIRGDMDALTVVEETGLPFSSENQGVMHACGHDCHTAMLLTAAKILNDNVDELAGTVKLAFQPAEELALGAISMIQNGALEGVDGCFGIHVWADVPAGKVCCLKGPMMAAADRFTIKVQGKGGHGAMPHQCIDAAVVSSAIISNLQTVVSRETSPLDSVVITVGRMDVGTRWNVVPDKGILDGTARYFTEENIERVPVRIESVAKDTAKLYGATAEVDYEKLLSPTINDPTMVDYVADATASIFGQDGLLDMEPTTGGEDFAFFMEHKPSAMAFVGVGNQACGAVWPHHSGHFCVDESTLINGALLYVGTAMNFNESK